MNAGLPGTGIGGLFYLLAALWMPVHQVAGRGAAGRPGRRRLVLVQTSIALSIVAGIWLTGWLLGLFVLPDAEIAQQAAERAGVASGAARNVVQAAVVFGALGILALVLAGVHVLRLLVRILPPDALAGERNGRGAPADGEPSDPQGQRGAPAAAASALDGVPEPAPDQAPGPSPDDGSQPPLEEVA